ncbi:hypothetical protein [Phytoactinopolyspora endophytica]|uniref:imine reductase family protein n=1 Tax=Phytoactinopolyspora endophytica TaxID=1642495 RepID=UPI00101CF8E1|nr:hypothetical protein [Phytoactinopolyspora endophytica]
MNIHVLTRSGATAATCPVIADRQDDHRNEAALLDIFWTGMAGVVHAFAMARASGVSASELLPSAQRAIDVLREAAAGIARDVDDGRYPADQPTVASSVAEMERVIRAAQSSGLDASVMRTAVTMADRVVSSGYGDDGIARMVEVLGRSAHSRETSRSSGAGEIHR